MFELDDKKTGEYLKRLVDEKGYETTADFCRAYLKLKNKNNDITETELQNERNRFGAIFKGKKKIQIHDLPALTELLCASCEEILSAGKKFAPTINHITNYEIAQSQDRKVWNEYMKREDAIFLNCDEYGKSVIDYALEFRNYQFMKYLLDEKYIWLVAPTENVWDFSGYRAGTIIKTNIYQINILPSELTCQDRLRTQTVALAIEAGDCDILDSLKARETPELRQLNRFGSYSRNFDKNRNDDLIEAIVSSENENIADYFSDEFPITDRNGDENQFMFPFICEVIDRKLDSNKFKYAEVFLKKSIAHNKAVFKKISGMIEKACSLHRDLHMKQAEELVRVCIETGFGANDENMLKRYKENAENFSGVLSHFSVNKYNVVSFEYRDDNDKYCSVVTNVVKVSSKKGSPEIKKLACELNELYDKIISLGGEEYGKVLL